MAKKKKLYPEDFGDNLYRVMVVKSVDESGELFVYADYYEVGPSGEVNFIQQIDDDVTETTLSIQSSNWKAIYLVDQEHDEFGLACSLIERPPLEEIEKTEEEMKESEAEEEIATTEENTK